MPKKVRLSHAGQFCELFGQTFNITFVVFLDLIGMKKGGIVMVSIMSNSGHTGYGIKEFVCDTPDDIGNLPVDAKPGSAAFVVSTGAVYMLNSKGEWVEI